MQLRFRLLLLAALVVLVVAGSVAAREEIKPQDGGESTDLEADGDKSKKPKDNIQLDSGKARVKQKWQRYKPPSSKKAKKAALRKEKALAKGGKEKWKVAAEEARGKKAKRSAQYVERDTASRQNLPKKDKAWKEGREKSAQGERRQPSGEGKRANVDKLKLGSKVTGKQLKTDKWKASEEGSVCAKDELCSSSSDESVGSEKKKWKRKSSGEEGTRGKSAQLNKAEGDNLSDGTEGAGANGRMEANSDKNAGEGEQGDVLKQRTTDGSKQAAKPKGKKSPEVAPAVQLDDAEVSSSKLKAAKVDRLEEADDEEAGEESPGGVGKNSSGNHKVKRSYIVEEEYDPECTSCSDGLVTDDTGGTESSKWNTVRSLGGQSRVRRYIVEEEIIEESADGEQEASDGNETPRLML